MTAAEIIELIKKLPRLKTRITMVAVTSSISRRLTRFTWPNHRRSSMEIDARPSRAPSHIGKPSPNQDALYDAMIAIAERRMDKAGLAAVLRRQLTNR